MWLNVRTCFGSGVEPCQFSFYGLPLIPSLFTIRNKAPILVFLACQENARAAYHLKFKLEFERRKGQLNSPISFKTTDESLYNFKILWFKITVMNDIAPIFTCLTVSSMSCTRLLPMKVWMYRFSFLRFCMNGSDIFVECLWTFLFADWIFYFLCPSHMINCYEYGST